jgi:hypothetical protein
MARNQQKKDLELLAILMDSQFKGPFGIKFGLDGLVGLIPVVGDLFTGGVSVYIILRAYRLGCSAPVIMRMILNVALETIVGAVPLLGNFFDFFWKSNLKNIELLNEYELKPKEVSSRSLISLILAFTAVLMTLALVIAVPIFILFYLISLF